MDPATHALTSLALARGFFPRRSWPFVAGVVLAGTLADMDLLTLLFGPDAYFTGRNTITHSLVGTVLVVAMGSAFAIACRARFPKRAAPGPDDDAASFATILLATSLAAVFHLLMDLAGPSGIALLWPFQPTRFAWDFLPFLDPWILALLLAGILLPELFALVSLEIGAKAKAPRGRNGAIAALALALIWMGARTLFHSNAAGQLDAHTYRGESPRRIAAFPDSLSPLAWHGVVETAAQICTEDVSPTGSTRFDPETAICVHKPEESRALRAATRTGAAIKFLQAARFPRASIGATENGSEVVLRDMGDSAQDETRHALVARVLLDRNATVTSQGIVWANNIKLR